MPILTNHMRAGLLLILVSLSLGGCHSEQEQVTAPAGSAEPTAEPLTTAARQAQEQVHYSPYATGGSRGKPFKNSRASYLGGEQGGRSVYFGDTHLHTSYSADAAFVGNTLGPKDAYRAARGEEVVSSTGVPARLSTPLDFVVVADHAENLGLAPLAAVGDESLQNSEFGRFAIEKMREGNGVALFDAWRKSRATVGDPMKGDIAPLKSGWEHIVESADQANQPGEFTAFIGFEWSSVPEGKNLHRNVIMRGDGNAARQILPFSNYDSEDVEDLWAWMAGYEEKTGDRVLAIPHNGNLSNGLMFDDVTFTTKQPISADYASRRQRYEPLYEVTQMKGDAEAHPALSPKDEFAAFETWDVGGINSIEAKTPEMLPREYARTVLARGLRYEATLGTNPFKFGLVGSTDAHTSIPATEENNYFGKVTPLEPANSHERFFEPVAGRRPSPEGKDLRVFAWQIGASGLVGVWAEENTRAALWDAMKRREVFATTGTRLQVRLFGGFDLGEEELQRADLATSLYSRAVPMGGDLTEGEEKRAPSFVVQAMRDPNGANLDRLQIIKGWADASGQSMERIYDLAVSGDRVIGEEGRCFTPVGNTVNQDTATYSNDIGSASLSANWTDPDSDPAVRAYYYVRVLEIPTPRWTTYDSVIFDRDIPNGAPVSIQERAYTSPIWYTPKS